MQSFGFKTVPDIEFGSDSLTALGSKAKALGIKKVCLVTDAGIVNAGLLDACLNVLKEADLSVFCFTEVVADPPEQVVIDATAQALSAGCDGVIGYGGGSSMDVAKLIAALLTEQQPLSQMYGVEQVTCARVPLIQVPTTAGTGSEVTAVAIVTTGEFTKAGVVSQTLIADAVILDPKLTLGLPPAVTAATGIDAMVHAIEAYTSVRLKNPLSDQAALNALTLMSRSIETAVFNGNDLTARSEMLLGAMLAGQAFANAPVGAVHALAYPLGGIYHIPHGLSNSLVLPHVLRFNAPAAAPLYKELAQVVMPEPCLNRAEEVAAQFAQYFLDLAKRLDLPTTLSAMGIEKTAISRLADEAMLQERLLMNNPRSVNHAQASAIYTEAF